jgi:uncharacterized membrane protein
MKNIIAILALLAFSSTSQACAVCMGEANTKLADASNSVFIVLLALVGFIFLSTGITIYFLWKKATTPLPPYMALIESINTEGEPA